MAEQKAAYNNDIEPVTKEEYDEQNRKIREAFDEYIRPRINIRPPLGGCSGGNQNKK